MSLLPLQTLINLLVTMKKQDSGSQTFAGMSIQLEFLKYYFELIVLLFYLSYIYDKSYWSLTYGLTILLFKINIKCLQRVFITYVL